MQVFQTRFGSWPAALAAAGMTVAPTGRSWTEAELAANLLVIELHGRTPIPAEMDRPPSTVSSKTYRNRYGDLAQARTALGI
jgi:hypothetical protein